MSRRHLVGPLLGNRCLGALRRNVPCLCEGSELSNRTYTPMDWEWGRPVEWQCGQPVQLQWGLPVQLAGEDGEEVDLATFPAFADFPQEPRASRQEAGSCGTLSYRRPPARGLSTEVPRNGAKETPRKDKQTSTSQKHRL